MKKKFGPDKFEFLISTLIIIMMSFTAFICNKDVTVSPPPPPVPKGFMKIQSNPEGSTIFLNGKNTGRKTPDSLTYLDYATYQVTLKRKYYRDTSIYVDVTEGVKIDTGINYFPNPLMYGSLNITSSPTNSQVYINDSSTGFTTPVIFNNLMPGLYSIRFKQTGFRDAVLSNIPVESNTIRTVYSQLQDTTIWVDFQVSNSNIPTNTLSCITADNNGVKWVGTFEYGLLKFNGSTFSEYNKTNSPLPDNNILCLNVDPANKLWIGTDNGLAVLDNGNWTIYKKDNSGLPINRIYALASESNNIIWIGTSVGLVKYDGNWQVYNITPSITMSVTTVSVDQSNTKWLGISDSSFGVLSFDGTTFTDYPISEYGYQTKYVSCSAASPSGQIWFGCNTLLGIPGGVTYFDGNSFTNIITSLITINNIFISDSDVKWISSNNGIYKIAGTSDITHYYNINSPLPSNDINGCVEDNEGNLWIATGTAGLEKFKGANQ